MMKEISIEEAKKIQLEILKKVAAFCDENGLRYFIYYGTYLGAIRHKGFIPWDDDIDICMPRADYEKFMDTFKCENLDVYTWRKDNKALLPFGKVYDIRTEVKENADFGETFGINIDIFPMDGLPSDEKKRKSRVSYMKRCQAMQIGATLIDPSKRSAKRRMQINLIKACYKVFHIKHYHTGRTIEHAKKYDFDKSEFVAVLVWGYGQREVVRRDSIFPLRKIQFEDGEFWAPGTDESLVNAFGDYMQLPPVEQQHYKHLPQMFWK